MPSSCNDRACWSRHGQSRNGRIAIPDAVQSFGRPARCLPRRVAVSVAEPLRFALSGFGEGAPEQLLPFPSCEDVGAWRQSKLYHSKIALDMVNNLGIVPQSISTQMW